MPLSRRPKAGVSTALSKYLQTEPVEVTIDQPCVQVLTQSLNPPPRYMSYGAAVTEAEADVLTGEWRILRTDILLDAGKSLNPAIDVGQIQGGYVMGLGNFLCEEILYNDAGKNVSDTTWEYKVSSDVRF